MSKGPEEEELEYYEKPLKHGVKCWPVCMDVTSACCCPCFCLWLEFFNEIMVGVTVNRHLYGINPAVPYMKPRYWKHSAAHPLGIRSQWSLFGRNGNACTWQTQDPFTSPVYKRGPTAWFLDSRANLTNHQRWTPCMDVSVWPRLPSNLTECPRWQRWHAGYCFASSLYTVDGFTLDLFKKNNNTHLHFLIPSLNYPSSLHGA